MKHGLGISKQSKLLTLCILAILILPNCIFGRTASPTSTRQQKQQPKQTQTQAPKSCEQINLISEKDSFSYVLGRDIAGQLNTFAAEINQDILLAAIREGFDTSKTAKIDEETGRDIMTTVMMRLDSHARAAAEAESAINQFIGAEFLAQNAQRPEVITTPSGLQYEVLMAGNVASPKPNPASIVEVHYVGTLVDGTEFDRSRDGNTIRFPVGGVIPGWAEGIQLMNVGAKFKFFIPPHLAYGERPLPGIGANSTLIFEVELVSFE